MKDHEKEIVVRTPDAIMPGPVQGMIGSMTPADLQRAIADAERAGAREITIKIDGGQPEYRGDDLLRRFLPYFVITIMGLVLIGGIAGILAMVIPPIMALIITLVGSLVSIILSLVATVIVAVIVAMGITMCQTINRRDELAARREEDRMDRM